MIKSRLALALVVIGATTFPSISPAPIVVRPGEAPVFVPPGTENAPDRASAEGQMEYARQQEAAGKIGAAIEGYRKVVRRFPKSPSASNAQFRVGVLLEKTGDLEGAYKAYTKLNKDYPRSEDFSASLEGQIRVAGAFLEGRRQKILGIPTVPSMGRAIDMYQSIIRNAPYSRYAPLAQFNIGRAKEKQADYGGAVTAYQIVVDKYPTSNVADDAMFQIGYVYLTIMRTGSYDRNAAKFAREYFEDFLVAYPKHEKAAQAREYLATLGQVKGKSVLKTAQFYDKQKAYKAAIMYYGEIVRDQPGTPDAKVASTRLDELRKKLGEKVFADPILTPGKPDPARVAALQGRGFPLGQGQGGQPVSTLPPNAPGLDAPLPGGETGLPPLGDTPGIDTSFDASNPFAAPTSLAPSGGPAPAPEPTPAPPAPRAPEASPSPTP